MNHPNHWKDVELQDLGKWKTGSTPRRSRDDYWGGDILWVSPKDMKTDRIVDTGDKMTEKALEETNSKIIPPDSIIMVTRSGILEHSFPIAINEKPVTINQDLKALIPSEHVNEEYIYYCLRAHEIPILKSCSKDGTTVASINSDSLYAYEIPLAPPSEQERIVTKIDELISKLDSGTAGLEKSKNMLSQYWQSVLNTAMAGELTNSWRKRKNPDPFPEKSIEKVRRETWEKIEYMKRSQRGKEPDGDAWKDSYSGPEFSDSDLPKIPDLWHEVTIDEIGIVVSGKTPKGIKDRATGGEIPWFRVGDMNEKGNNKYLKHSEYSLTPEVSEDMNMYIYPKNTVVFPKRGGAIKTNKTRILNQDSAYDLNIMGVIPTVVAPLFLYYWFDSFDLTRIADGTNVPQINHGDIKSLSIPLPPEAEQELIIKKLDRVSSVVSRLGDDIGNNIQRSKRLRQATLVEAFRGTLTSQITSDAKKFSAKPKAQNTLTEAMNDGE